MSSDEDINGGNIPPLQDSPRNSKDNALFEPKSQPKVIRVLIVLAYVLSVSMAAILLSIYYIFVWEGQPHLGALKTAPSIEDHFYISSTPSSIAATTTAIMTSSPTTIKETFLGSTSKVTTEMVQRTSGEMQQQADFTLPLTQNERSSSSTPFLANELTTTPEPTEDDAEDTTLPDADYTDQGSSDDDDDNFARPSSTFIQKLMYIKHPYDEND